MSNTSIMDFIKPVIELEGMKNPMNFQMQKRCSVVLRSLIAMKAGAI
jgi:hypothetical protein